MDENEKLERLRVLLSLFPNKDPYCLQIESQNYLQSQEKFASYIDLLFASESYIPVTTNSKDVDCSDEEEEFYSLTPDTTELKTCSAALTAKEMEEEINIEDDATNNNREHIENVNDLLQLFDPLSSSSTLDELPTLVPNFQLGPFIPETSSPDSNGSSLNEEELRSDFKSMLAERFCFNQKTTEDQNAARDIGNNSQFEARGAIPKCLKNNQGCGDISDYMEVGPELSVTNNNTKKIVPEAPIDIFSEPNFENEIFEDVEKPNHSSVIKSNKVVPLINVEDNDCEIIVFEPKKKVFITAKQKIPTSDPFVEFLDSVSPEPAHLLDNSDFNSNNTRTATEILVGQQNNVEDDDLDFLGDTSSSSSQYANILKNIGNKLSDNNKVNAAPLAEKEQHTADDIDTQYSMLLNLFPNSDPMYLYEKLNLFFGNQELLEKFITEETERAEDNVHQEQLLEKEYIDIMKELPHLDPELLRQKWSEVAGDQDGIRQLINTEKEKLKNDITFQKLRNTFPDLSPSYLKTKLQQLSDDDVGLQLFIEEEKAKQASETQFIKMINALPTIDPAELRIQWDLFQGDPLLVDEYIQEKQIEIQIKEERESQWLSIQAMLPDCDPDFLKRKYEETGGDTNLINDLVFSLINKKDYPKSEEVDPEYRERKEQWNRFNSKFNIKEYIKCVSDPVSTFSGCQGDNNPASMTLILNFLQYRYPNSTVQELTQLFNNENKNLTKTCRRKDRNLPYSSIVNCWTMPNEPLTEQFLKEVCFIQNRERICDYMRTEKSRREKELELARRTNNLWPCLCCFETEVLTEDIVTCPDGHTFCKECFRKYVETELGDAKTTFKCITDCTKEFTLSILERCLPHNVYIKIEKKKQAEEVSAAALDDLVSCPCCDFMQPLSPDDKVFKCLNPSCLKETCRLCKEPNHIPLRCNEVERPKDVQARVGIEETMTEALVRTCYKCNKKFVKVDGCNKMTCSCGAIMCYICRKPVTDYTHFNGQGGTNYNRCPLWSNNAEIHERVVENAGRRARDDVLRENPDLRLVYDPLAI